LFTCKNGGPKAAAFKHYRTCSIKLETENPFRDNYRGDISLEELGGEPEPEWHTIIPHTFGHDTY
jgi:hypothetical protein